MSKVICEVCGKQFNKKPSQIKKNPRHYCSRKCQQYAKNGFDRDLLQSKEWLSRKLMYERLSTKEISELLGCNVCTVQRAAKNLGLQAPPPIWDDKEWLHQLYVIEQKTAEEIGSIAGCSRAAIQKALKKHGIEARKSGPRSGIISEIMRKIWGRPGYKEKMSKSFRVQRGTEENLHKMSERAKRQWESPEARARLSESSRKNWEKEGFRESQSEKARRQWEDPQFRQLQVEKATLQAKQMWSNPEFKEMMKRMWESEEFRQRSSELMKANWESKEFRDKHAKASSEQFLRLWQNPDFQQRQAERRALLRSGMATSIELSIASLLDDMEVSYKSQVPIGRWTCDFVLSDTPLVIECDGDYWHNLDGVPERDQKKDRELSGLGYAILRLSERRIKREIDDCLASILTAIDALEGD